MCFGSLAPFSPSTDSESSSPTQLLPRLPPHPSHPSAPTSTTTNPHEGSIRKRVVRACEVCRRKKVKCNGQKPCSQCIAFAEECVYVDVKDRSAYSRRYVEGLEARLSELEKTVAILSKVKSCNGSCRRREVKEAMRRASDPGAGIVAKCEGQRKDGLPVTAPQVHGRSKRLATVSDSVGSGDLSTLSANYLIHEAIVALQARSYPTLHGSTSLAASQERALNPSAATTPQPSFELDGDLQVEVDVHMKLCPLPTASDFLASLEAFVSRVYPFCPILSPLEARLAWQQVACLSRSPDNSHPTTTALVFAVMACGAQSLGSTEGSVAVHPAQQTQTTARDLAETSSMALFRQAKVWAKYMNEAGYGGREALQQAQVHALLGHFSVVRGTIHAAAESVHIARKVLDDVTCVTEEQGTSLLRVSHSIGLLEYLLTSLRRSLPDPQHELPVERSALGASRNDDNISALFCNLSRLSQLCSISGPVGSTMSDLLDTHPTYQAVETLRIRAQRQEQQLLEWYESLPLAFRTSPAPDSVPSLAMGSCIAFASFHFERLRLHLALQQLWRRSGAVGTDEKERSDLARCMQIAGHTIQAFPTIREYLWPSPWLTVYAQCIGMSAAFLALIAARQAGCNVGELLIQVQTAVKALGQLEEIIQGVSGVRVKLTQLASGIRSQLGGANGSAQNVKREAGVEGHSTREESANKRFRAATLPQSTPHGVVSPIYRPETAPPMHPPPAPPHFDTSTTTQRLISGVGTTAMTQTASIHWPPSNDNSHNHISSSSTVRDVGGSYSDGERLALGLGHNLFDQPASVFPLASPSPTPPFPPSQHRQQHQQQPDQGILSAPGAFLDPNHEAMMAGLLQQFMDQQEQHVHRQV